MKSLTRREFLRLVAASSGSIALNRLLAACGIDPLTVTPELNTTQLPTKLPVPTNTSQPHTVTAPQTTPLEPTSTSTPVQPTSTATPPGSPDLVVARNGDPKSLVRRAIAAMGGMQQFVPKNADVIIKPNICVSFLKYEYGATTNPWVVGELVKLAFEAGARRVRVMDHTWRREMTEAYINSGIAEQVEAAGGEMEWMPLEKFIPTQIPQGRELQSLDLYEDILNADVLINVPIAKTHQDAKLTLGIKNLMGVMDKRLTMHTPTMGQRLADLSSRVVPTLNVMDAVRMMVANGPISGYLGDVKQVDTIIVSRDIVALDSYTATMFDMQPSDIDYLRAASSMGLGRIDIENLRIEEFNIN